MTGSKFCVVLRSFLLLLLLFSGSSSLTFSKGDVISCSLNLNPFVIHDMNETMLAINSEEVIHAWYKEKFVGMIGVRNFKSFTESNELILACDVVTERYNEAMSPYQPFTASTAIQRAENDLGRIVRYGVLKCNCEHWVSFWKYGVAYSPQSRFFADNKCKASLRWECEDTNTCTFPKLSDGRPIISSSSSPSFSKGDVIACDMEPRAAFGTKLVMLAVNSEEVIHFGDMNEQDFTVNVKMTNFKSFTENPSVIRCAVVTELFDELLTPTKPYDASTAVARAKWDLGRTLRFDFEGCNSEHWVRYWRYGEHTLMYIMCKKQFLE